MVNSVLEAISELFINVQAQKRKRLRQAIWAAVALVVLIELFLYLWPA